jgi:glycosyltransferase involved in cell wall biosynthesis
MQPMTSKNALSVEVQEHIESVGKADILVGIPSYNNEKTIEHVVRAVQFGLAKHFPKHRSVLMNSDGGSGDKTRQIVRKTSVYGDLDTIFVETPVRPVRSLATPYRGIMGKGSAFRAIFEVADQLDVKACILVDSDLRSISPEWVELLGAPVILKEYDFVAPFYSRHKYDATITNAIAYPLTRALYGRRVRQPIGGDFCVSRKLIDLFLQQDVWGTDVARYGIDIWMTTTAINEGFKLCQSFLGAKVHDAKDPGKSLGPMFKQVVGTLFRLMGPYQSKWRTVKKSRPIALYGFKSRFHFPNEIWINTIYDFAIAYHRLEASGEGDLNDLVESLVPIYFGRTASFVLKTGEMDFDEAEDLIGELAKEFEKLKPYLVKNWGFGKQ